MFPIVILAGGLATRIRPLTEKIPKSLIEVASEPFIFHQLRYLKSQGLKEVVLCTGYLGEQVEEVVGAGEGFGLNIIYSNDGEKLLGTGGAIKKAQKLLNQDFFVLYGDSFLPVNYETIREAYLNSGKPALMTVLKNNNSWDKSNVIYKNGELVEYNKQIIKKDMEYIDYGLSVFSKKCFDEIEIDLNFDLSELLNQLSVNHQLAGFEVYERFYEVGSFDGIKDTDNYLKEFLSCHMQNNI
jgi:MurNAc alpha-1-phosphate uridylyltransferase